MCHMLLYVSRLQIPHLPTDTFCSNLSAGPLGSVSLISTCLSPDSHSSLIAWGWTPCPSLTALTWLHSYPMLPQGNIDSLDD